MESYGKICQPLLEIACFNLESAVNASDGGADRIELCQDYTAGGLSPDAATLQAVKARVALPVYVMIRPQSENFWYSESEFEIMKRTLESAKILGADGFVFGILNKIPEDGKQHALSWVDVSRNKQLVQLAGGKPCTFHRAFDCIPESCWDAAFSQITECGFAAILTNGGPSSDKAIDCVDKLATLASKQDHLFRQLARTGIPVPDIIVGGGVRSTNIQALLKGTNAHVFHSSALKTSSEVVEKKEVEKLRESLMMLRRSPEGQYSIG